MIDHAQHDLTSMARLAVRTDAMLGIDLVLVDQTAITEPGGESTPAPAGVAPPIRQDSAPAPGARRPSRPTVPVSIDAAYFDEGVAQASRLSRLQEHHACSCTYCLENDSDHVIVFGEGAPDASLMFVGESPGTEEERQGRPFVGRAGSKLDEMIKAMGLRREDVYITNALKSRPPGTRPSEASDFERCGAFFAAQVRIIKPAVIVALGGPASKLLLQSELGITSLRGAWGCFNDGNDDVALMPTFHPAYLVRNPTLEVRGQVWADLQEVMKRLGLSAPPRD
tara:strand:- start:953 stop:1798 length:846 start_codon:yes stop_codon:yes gene_type:complete